jgi:excinuclease ABC subunit C
VIPESVRAKLEALPASPGVYVFRDRTGGVLYVGKARSLRSRVRSYFAERSGDDRYFVALLEEELGDVETFVVATEKEAALLENQLIKEHQPRYNVKLRDDKDYLSLRLDPRASWPRLEVVRRPRPDGARYYGPYHSATSARQTLRLVNRFFQLRTCTDAELKSRTRPCLQFQIKRCPAPCVFDVPRDQYDEQTRLVGLFLDGRHDELVRDLAAKMDAAAERQDYELAAVYRDQLRSVDRVREEQNVSTVKNVDQDVIGMFRQADQAELAVLMVRSGKLVGVRTFDLKRVRLPNDETIASFVREYYEDGSFVPQEVVLPVEIEAMAGLAEVLTERRGARVQVLVPRRGPRASLSRMAQENAAHAFAEKARAREDVAERLAQLQRRLHLERPPHRIECIDVSHSAGDDAVAAVVALEDGAPDRKRYKSFVVKRAARGDDYGAMHEVLSRRFRRARRGDGGWEAPDLLVVDGGKGQLNVALAALRDLELGGVPVVALAKEKETALGNKLVDRVYLPGRKNPIALRESSPALQVLALARDEAHRASNLHRKRKSKKRTLSSELDGVPGVGVKTRNRLLAALGSVRAVRDADIDTLRAAGATLRQAQAIVAALGPSLSTEAHDLGRAAADAERSAIENAFVVDDGSD